MTHGGKTGGADDHGVTAAQSRRQRDQPVAAQRVRSAGAAPVVSPTPSQSMLHGLHESGSSLA